jgi:hypothetical protein
LLKDGVGVSDAPPPFRARITAMDLAGNRITLNGKLPAGEALRGRVIFLRGGKHRTAYHIAEVLPSGNEVRLDLNSILFRSRLEGIAKDKSHLVTELSPPVEKARGFKPGYYDDAVVTGEDLKARYRVKKIEDNKIFLDRPARDEDFPDADGDGRRMVQLYDHGEGDEAMIPCSVFMRQ